MRLIAIGIYMATNGAEMTLLNDKEFVALKNTFAWDEIVYLRRNY